MIRQLPAGSCLAGPMQPSMSSSSILRRSLSSGSWSMRMSVSSGLRRSTVLQRVLLERALALLSGPTKMLYIVSHTCAVTVVVQGKATAYTLTCS